MKEAGKCDYCKHHKVRMSLENACFDFRLLDIIKGSSCDVSSSTIYKPAKAHTLYISQFVGIISSLVCRFQSATASVLLTSTPGHAFVLPPSIYMLASASCCAVPYIFDNMASLTRRSLAPQTCLVLPRTSPCTFVQSIFPSTSSSTRPHTATLSPRTMYSPKGTSSLGNPSSAGRMMRSYASASTRFIDPSQEKSVPTMVRPSSVRTETFSGLD